MKKLHPLADFLTVYTDRIWKRTRECADESGTFVPMLSFISENHEFTLPISYDAIVEIGMGVRDIENSAKQVATVGVPFSLFAMEIAERSRVAKTRAEDKADLFATIGGILNNIHPQAFFLSLPITMQLERQNDRKRRDMPAILVVGRNQVRSYSVLTPYRMKQDSGFWYGRSIILDSIAGDPHQAHGPLARIYEPPLN